MPSLFKAEITGFRIQPDSSAVEYIINVCYNVDLTNWTTHKRYSDFDSLRNTLSESHSDLPDLPQKTLWKKTDPDFLEQRRVMLQDFLKSLLSKRELATSPEVSAFLCIHKYLPDILLFLPCLRSTTQLGLVTRKIALEGSKVFCLGREESTTYRLETYFKNWRNSEANPIGCAFLVDNQKVVWRLPFHTNPTSMCWEPALTVLACGLDDGRVLCVRVCTELDCTRYEPYCELHPHFQAVVGLALDYRSAYLYSCGLDNRLCICELNSQSLVTEMALPGAQCSAFTVFEHRAYIANEAGQVLVYEISPASLIYRFRLKACESSPVRALAVNQSYIVAGHESGALAIFSNSSNSHLAVLQGAEKVRTVLLTDRELFTGTKSGCICAWELEQLRIIYSWKAHIGGVYALQWEAETRTIYSGGWDRSLKAWQLSEHWQDLEVLRRQSDFLGSAELPQQLPVRRNADEEDELMGWDSR